MRNLLVLLVFALPVVAQQSGGPSSPIRATATLVSTPPGTSDDVAQVMALEHQIEDAVVRGDVAFFDRVTPADFSFVHGDKWTTGGKPLATDDKKAFLKRVADKEYLIHDLDQVKVEPHGDIIITYGRYVSLFEPKNATAPGKLASIWFERVYAKRNGQWMFLSHRTVHGPNISPAGVDPSVPPAAASK